MARSILRTSSVLLLAFAANVYSLELSQCDNMVMRTYYEDIGCVPGGDEPCPSSYNCDAALRSLSPGDGACLYKNKVVQNGKSFDSGEPCSGQCICRVDDDGVASYNCPVYDCNFERLDEGCYYRYAPDKCCPVGINCPQNDTSIARCEYGGETYYEGMSFRPDNYECVSCTCKEGFKGVVEEPWCEVSSHNYILHKSRDIYNGCVPVFIPSVCYAPEWRCPEDKDKVVPSGGQNSAAGKCTFGSLELNIGDKLSGEEYKCSCITPPYVTCTK
ncbi:uncharacterized protein [Anabrus simplex]|uniref:uncharacterized protein n=1 Tax=Anabrus simplex TaxID=316456 RepID=UPI0034DDAB52